MGVCNSCDRENDHDARKAENAAFEQMSSQLISNSVRSFHFPSGEQSRGLNEPGRFSIVKNSLEPGARVQSGVFKIPNQFSPEPSPSALSPKRDKQDVLDWGVCEVVTWWCEKLPDEAIQYAPLVEDTQLKGEDLVAMDLELLMSFQIDRPLAEHILGKIERLMRESIKHRRNLTACSTATTTTNGDHVREYTMTSTGETQVFSDPEGDSIPSYWKAPGVVEETDDECARIQSPVMMIMIDDDGKHHSEEHGLGKKNTISPQNDPLSLPVSTHANDAMSPPRSPLSLLPPNSPRMNQEVEEDRIAQLEKQIQVLQDQLNHKQIQVYPTNKNLKKPNSRSNSGSSAKEKSRGVAKGRRKNGKNPKRKQGKFSVYKEGPTDIGRIENWSPARYDIEDDGRQFLDERLNSVQKKDQNYHVYKEGPRDIGTVSTGWKPYRHTREDSGRDFLAPRINRTKPVVRAPVRKSGPRGKAEVTRKRSSLIESSEGSRKSCSSRKNSGKRKSSSRSSSNKRKSSSRRNSRSSNNKRIRDNENASKQSRSSSRQRQAHEYISNSPQNFTSGDFRLLKMSFNYGGEDSSMCESPRMLEVSE